MTGASLTGAHVRSTRGHGCRTAHARHPRPPQITDARDVACGRDFTAVLTWSGEVYVCGGLGGRTFHTPSRVEPLRGAAVASIAAGQGHLVMVTGLREDRERVEQIGQEQREAAGEHLRDVIGVQQAKLDKQQAKAAAAVAAARAHNKDEKRRVRLIKRLQHARDRLKPKARKQYDEDGELIVELEDKG